MPLRASTSLYRRRVNRVLDHIQVHLAEPLSVAELARVAHFSRFHFHRIFRALVGEPLHAFVRRLRLEQAVRRMQHGPRATLTSIALQTGFASSSDFSRAFKQAYGQSPRHCSREWFVQESKIRQDLLPNAGYGFGKRSDSRNPDRFRVRLVDRPMQRIAYERVVGPFEPRRLMGAFERLMTWGRKYGLVPTAELLGRSPDDPDVTPMKKLRFDWCLVLPPSREFDGDVSFGVIPANRYAALRCRGDIQKEDRAWRYLFGVWLPGSGYEPADEAGMEVYRRHPAQVGWETFDLDCCLPVRPLQRRAAGAFTK